MHSLLLEKHSVVQGERLRKDAIYAYHILRPPKFDLSVDLRNKVSNRYQKAFRCRTTSLFIASRCIKTQKKSVEENLGNAIRLGAFDGSRLA